MRLPGERGPSLGERLLEPVLWLLAVLVALTWAVELIVRIWPWLLVASIGAGLLGWWRQRTRGW